MLALSSRGSPRSSGLARLETSWSTASSCWTRWQGTGTFPSWSARRRPSAGGSPRRDRMAASDDLPVRRCPGASLGGRVRQVRLDRVVEGAYAATVEVEGPLGMASVDARPSDALNLAALVDATIFAAA